MQWLLWFFTLLVMVLLQRVARGFAGPVEAHATLALGCVTLAATLAGVIAHRLRLPRVVGYLFAGFIAGPSWLRIVHEDELQVLAIIATGALALIAFAVGSELTLEPLRGERRRALLRILTGAMAFPFAAVALVVLTVSPWFPLTAHQPFRDALAVALALGTLAAVGSPTLTWAVLTDREARGSLSRTLLDVTVLQDLSAVVLLVLILALALPLASRGAVTPGIATHTLLVIVGSIAVGTAIGFGAAQYVRAVSGGSLPWLFAILAFAIAQAVRLLGLDAVLLSLAAGCTLRHALPEHSDRVRSELKRCAIPVYVVFFALAGSGLQLGVLADMWPWALLLAGLRLTGLWGGMRWAGRGKAEWDFGWLGLVSQGGLAVTLAALLRRAFPEWNISLEALLLAMVGIHELVGPVCLEWVLRRAGEVTDTEGAHVAETPGSTESAEVGAALLADGSGSV
jgi:Kef-type K+ transport system membrane component KefB